MENRRMDELTNLVPRDRHAGGSLEVFAAQPQALPFDMMSPEPHLLDYVRVLRKHQWLILFFLLSVVTIVTIATLRMTPIYTATARLAIDRENANILPFPGTDSYDIYLDLENYIETQAKILQTETLALQTIRNLNLADRPEFGGQLGKTPQLAAMTSTANQRRPPALGAFLGSLSVRRVPT